MRRIAVLVTAASLAAASAGGVHATRSARSLEFFRLPSGNIGCSYATRPLAPRPVLRCDVLTGLRPEPRGRCELDWTGLAMRSTGRAAPTCAGDTSLDRRSRVLRYGQTWRRVGFTCTSSRAGLRCSNRARHGFFLSRGRWRTF